MTSTATAPTNQKPATAVATEPPQKAFEKKKKIFRFYQVIWYILAIIEVLLGFRMLFKALGANPISGFTSLIYGVTDPLTLPFRGIFASSVSGIYVIEWSTLIAMAVYAVVAYGLVAFLQFAKPVSPQEVEQTVDEQ